MTLRQKAYRCIKDKIIYFEFKPGDKILESRIAQSLKLGRVPVREALTMLESEQLIEKTEGYGYVVAALDAAEIDDYFSIRAALEKIGAALLIARITDHQIKRMKAHVENSKRHYEAQDLTAIIISDTKFHELMYRATQSGVFFQSISSLSDKSIMLRAAALQSQEGRQSSLRDHRAIFAAIEQRDLEQLQRILQEHLKFAPNYFRTRHL